MPITIVVSVNLDTKFIFNVLFRSSCTITKGISFARFLDSRSLKQKFGSYTVVPSESKLAVMKILLTF